MLKMRNRGIERSSDLPKITPPIQSWVSLWAKWLETMALTTILYCLWLLYISPLPQAGWGEPISYWCLQLSIHIAKGHSDHAVSEWSVYASVFLLALRFLRTQTASYSYFYLFCLINCFYLFIQHFMSMTNGKRCERKVVSLFLPFTWCPRW